MIEGQVCQNNEVVVVVTSQSQEITTTMIEPTCATFSACNAKSTGSTATETTTHSCAAASHTKRNAGATSVPLTLQSRVNSPTECEESFQTIIYPLDPFDDYLRDELDNFQATKRGGGDTTFRYEVIDSPSLGFTAFYWVSAMSMTEIEDFSNTLDNSVCSEP